jgi:hypothetical protein
VKAVVDGYKLVIEKGIPAPRVRGEYYALIEQMRVGDSVLFPVTAKRSAYNAVHFANKISRRLKQKRHYISRRVENGYRIWRVK